MNKQLPTFFFNFLGWFPYRVQAEKCWKEGQSGEGERSEKKENGRKGTTEKWRWGKG